MNPHLERRLKGIQDPLNAHYAGGDGLPNSMIGVEREAVVNDFLARVIPPVFRFGRGAITDVTGELTGQLDTVMELPFSANYPIPGGEQRLYLAESVCAVIEIKSNLYAQWGEAQETVRKVKRLSRDIRQTSGLLDEESPVAERGFDKTGIIPCYFVAFTGHTTIDGIQKRLAETPPDQRPDGVLVIASGCYVGKCSTAEGPWGLHEFVADLLAHANAALQIAYPFIRNYGHSSGSHHRPRRVAQ